MLRPIASLVLLVAAGIAAAEEKPAPKFTDGKVRLLNTLGTPSRISNDGLTANTEPVRLKQFIRGFATATPNGTLSLVVQSGGKATVVELVRCKIAAIPRGDDKKWKPCASRGKLLGEGFEFLHECEVTLPADTEYRVTFFLLAERSRKDATEGGLLSVDSLDFEIQKPKWYCCSRVLDSLQIHSHLHAISERPFYRLRSSKPIGRWIRQQRTVSQRHGSGLMLAFLSSFQ